MRRLRLDLATRLTPVVMISADVASAKACPGFLVKPLNVRSVLGAIDLAMRSEALAG